MIQHEFEELLEQFSQDELNEKSTVKGQFTSYITRRMEWHAIRYAAKNRPNVIVISLEQAPRHLTDIDAEQMFRKVEIELALQQCNLVRRTEKGRLRRRGWGLRWEKAQKGGKGTNLRGFFED